VVLNRVVGQLDPTTGLRNPFLTPAPSQILGSIKAPGTVLILNQNGIIFGGTSQINTGSLIATSLEIGRAIDLSSGPAVPLTIKQRDDEFLTFGFLGFADQAAQNEQTSALRSLRRSTRTARVRCSSTPCSKERSKSRPGRRSHPQIRASFF